MSSEKVKKALKKTGTYILRSWDKDSHNIHPRLKLLPPFLVELLGYILAGAVLYQAGLYLLSLT